MTDLEDYIKELEKNGECAIDGGPWYEDYIRRQLEEKDK